MNLSDNTLNDLDVTTLRGEFPVSFQIFEIFHSGSCIVLIPVSDEKYGDVDLAHGAAARAKKNSPWHLSRFTYLPVVG